MASPVALKDLPKVDMDLKSQLESFSPKNLKNASTEEKMVLPTAEGESSLNFFKLFKIFMRLSYFFLFNLNIYLILHTLRYASDSCIWKIRIYMIS
jgi:hypothetical protein